MAKSKLHYSGEGSKQFWGRIAKLKLETDNERFYTAGILLQEMEARILAWLDQAEQKGGR